ncbi:MAG: response regulator [Spirulina sp.]
MTTSLEPGTILIIDDNPTNLEVLYGALDGNGYEILVEMDGESGIDQVKTNPPDLILLDIMMPGIDGFETCRRLKADEISREIPIIFMTALADTEDKVKGLRLGAVDYITKPFHKEEILARIQVHLKLRQMSLELAQQNEKLEQRVQERTAKLSHALEDLRSAQLQLVQAEKMSSLGQLVAGVAHEINNPVNFIHGNIGHLKEYIESIISFLNLYQACYPEENAKIEDLREDLDVDFLIDDIPKIMASMKLGVKRIRQIVASLRNFSRLDEAEKKPVDIHEGIESTLLILHHRLKANPKHPEVEVIKNYGNLPPVECYAGQLNQVFMNILSNAVDALEEQAIKDRHQGQIIISTQSLEDRFVRIGIKDNGIGISEKTQNRIFDPFFTTKPVGKGTGLGLSISYKIITEGHHGRLYCQSQGGEGTEFIIEIPIQGNPLSDRDNLLNSASFSPLQNPSNFHFSGEKKAANRVK